MKNKLLISVLIPTYNRPEYLKECLDSILEQKWFSDSELEFIISDNSDNNETKELVEKYIINNREKNIIYNKNIENIWAYRNLNKLLEIKKWKYFIFVCDDDKFYNENSLKLLYDNLIKYNLDCIYWLYFMINSEWEYIYNFYNIKHTFFVNKKNTKIDIMTKRKLLYRWAIWLSRILYKDYWIMFDIKAWPSIDYEYNVAYAEKYIIWCINQYVLKYRMHNSNDTLTANSQLYDDYIYKKYWLSKITRTILYYKSKLIILIVKFLNLIFYFLKLFLKK